jgi:putative transposase
MADGDPVDPPSRRRSVSRCCVLRVRTRAGVTSGSLVGSLVSATTVAKILRRAGVSPAGARAQLSWRDFLRAHADSIIACDFFTVETLWLGRLHVLFFLELGSRRVHFAGCTANPDGRWTAQQARQLAWSLSERARPARFLIHDRDSKFSRAFDEVFRSEGVEIIRTPFRAPKANAFAERWVGTVRRAYPTRFAAAARSYFRPDPPHVSVFSVVSMTYSPGS